jgi:Tfp pilus assembly protein PilX
MKLACKPQSLKRQRGISLVVVTILILAVVLMSLSAFNVSKTQYQLVGNIQASEQAFGAAEATTAGAENWLVANAKSAAFETYSEATPHLYPRGQLATSGHQVASMDWDNSNSSSFGSGRYLIELMARNVRLPGDSIATGQKSTACKAVDLFRITAKAEAGRSGMRILETVNATTAC